MALFRFLSGLLAILAIAAAFNLLLITGDTFSQYVTLSLAVAALAFVVWVALVMTGAFRRQQQESRSLQGFSTAISTVIFFAICVVIFAFASRWEKTWDLSQEGRAELAPQTIQVLQALDKDVEVTCFFPGVARRDVDYARDKAQRFLERCERISYHIKPEFFDAESSVLRQQQLGVTPEQFQQAAGVVVLKSGNSKRYIAIEGVMPRLTEQDFTNALINVVRGADDKIYFLTGHGECDVASTSTGKRIQILSRTLAASGFRVETLEFDGQSAVVPQDCDVLFVAGPETDLQPGEIAALQEYKKRAGRLFVMKDIAPGGAIVEGPTAMANFYNWLVADWGIKVGRDTIITYDASTDILLSPALEGFGDEETPGQHSFKGSYNYEHPIVRGFAHTMQFEVVSSVSLDSTKPEGVERELLLRSRAGTWAETNVEGLYLGNSAGRDSYELKGPIPIAAAASATTGVAIGDTGQTRDARIVVVGDCNFINDYTFQNSAGVRNFVLNCLAWLTEQEELIADRAGDKIQEPIVLSVGQQQTIAWITTLGTLQTILLVALVVYVLRRKYS